MKSIVTFILVLFLVGTTYAQEDPGKNKNKQAVIASVASKYDQLTDLSDKIWSFEEIAFQEKRSSEALAKFAESHGFKVERGVADIPTALVAEYGSGSPIIGILGEFDALPGLSQKTVPTKDPLNDGAAGHGCGHNLFGVASLGAAIAIKELIEEGKLQGTIRFYGTPAEEKFFGKLWMIRAGLFDDVDVVMDWHPSAETKTAVQSSLALGRFYGRIPWAGSSCLQRSLEWAQRLRCTGVVHNGHQLLPRACQANRSNPLSYSGWR